MADDLMPPVSRSGALRAALERIIEGVPAHDNHNGLFFAHFDENGNEVGIEHVDPMAVIGSMLGVATAALRADDSFAASEKPPSEDITEAYQRILTLTKALEQCVRVAQMWHGDDAFDIYFNHSPEMKLVRAALGKMPDPTEA